MNYLKRNGTDSVEMPDGTVVKMPAVRQLGEPPWELEIDDLWEEIIPDEATELVGAISWRGIRFKKATARRGGWMATSLSYTTDSDITRLRDVYVNGVRFTRARKKDFDDVGCVE